MSDGFDSNTDLTEQAAREPTALERLAKHDAPFCSRCRREVPGCGDAVGVLCDRCTAYLTGLWPCRGKRKQAKGRACPDCGALLGVRQKVCSTCRERRRKQRHRTGQRRRRAGVTQFSENGDCNPLSDKG